MLFILDRDGVINEDKGYVKNPQEWQAIPGSLQAIKNINDAGHLVAVATNQSGIGRGYYTEQDMHDVHQKMKNELECIGAHIDMLCYCPHAPEEQCNCRKPQPGMLKNILSSLDIVADDAVMIGDSIKDAEVARAVNVQPILLHTGKNQCSTATDKDLKDVRIFDDLNQAVHSLLSTMR